MDGGDRSRPELIVVVGGKTFERNDEVWEEEEGLGCRSIEEESPLTSGGGVLVSVGDESKGFDLSEGEVFLPRRLF